jgi:hypothetical protein
MTSIINVLDPGSLIYLETALVYVYCAVLNIRCFPLYKKAKTNFYITNFVIHICVEFLKVGRLMLNPKSGTELIFLICVFVFSTQPM